MDYQPVYKVKSKVSITNILASSRSLSRDPSASHFSLSHPKRIPWLGTPLRTERDHEDEHGNSHEHHEEEEQLARGEPPLKRSHESSIIQLFYDLFFVANLTTFTGVHEVNDPDTLKSYIGFFALLWFTWFQVALFDIRFGMDSVIERIFKAVQFGVMTGFAVVGPSFNVGFESTDQKAINAASAFQKLTLIMMVSRLVLAAQYSIVIIQLRHHKRAIVPLLTHVAVLLISAFVFLGLNWVFTPENGSHPLVGWYVVIGLESATILLVSGLRRWRFLNFRNTCIVERLGLLTLIILGEGIIGLCSTVQRVGLNGTWGSDVIGMVISSVVIIYCMWMLYFDQTETRPSKKAVGTLRQQAWILCHFPFHLAILFLVEGCSQLSIFRKVYDTWLAPIHDLDPVYNSFTEVSQESLNTVAEAVKQIFEGYYKGFEGASSELKFPANTTSLENAVEGILALGSTLNTTLANGTVLYNQTQVASDINYYVELAWEDFAVFAANNLGFAAPEKATIGKGSDASDVIDNMIEGTLVTVLYYFFFCAAMTLIMTAILMTLGKRGKRLGDALNVGFRALVGTGLLIFFIVVVALESNADATNTAAVNLANYGTGPWVLPTVAICLLFVVIVDNGLRNWVHMQLKKDKKGWGNGAFH